MTKLSNQLTAFVALAGSCAFSHSQVTPAQTRGALLYTTHRISCHTTQVHWRNNKLASDGDSLKVQVPRWQGNAGLQWGEADIDEVSRYLNETIYRYPTQADRVGLVSKPKSPSTQQTNRGQRCPNESS